MNALLKTGPHARLIALVTVTTIAITLFLSGAYAAPAPDIELISISTDGQAGNGISEIRAGAVSADGRYVVFSSLASNLTADNTSGWHVYLGDREAATTTLISDTGEDTDESASRN